VDTLLEYEIDDETRDLVEWVKAGWYPKDFRKDPASRRLKSWKDLEPPEGKRGPEEWALSEPGAEVRVPALEIPGRPAPEAVEVPIENIRSTPYDPRVIREGGLKSFTRFIHYCLRLKGLGTSPDNHYEWEARSRMAYIDLAHMDWFPLFDFKPGRLEEPVYVFRITRVGGKPLQWIVAAEVEDILRGKHVLFEGIWAQEYAQCIQKGILDRLEKPEGVWAGGICGSLGIVKAVGDLALHGRASGPASGLSEPPPPTAAG
jgi:hypothetical protein